ncbi:MAG: copper amine oxidase N-terminal domain-containing protein [Clostridiales bacterium]|nr:copper amine oxidase N-terminal domain-containing protein [Clostridiales bacterium]
MKKFFALCVTVLTVMGVLTQNTLAAWQSLVPETNLGRLSVYGYPENAISYGYSMVPEKLPENGIFLYINGSIYAPEIIIENSRTLVPLRFISENLGAQVGWDDATRNVTITDGSNKIELVIGNNKPTLNGKVIQIDAAPKIFNDYTYVPLRFIAESLNCKVDWVDGYPGYNGDPANLFKATHYPIGNRQVIISRYPSGATAMSQEGAIKLLKDQLMIAYENRFGVEFSPLDAMPASGDEQETYRYTISHISILYENDRFYTIWFNREFMVDKYTGTVFLYYNGQTQTINVFNPFSPGALTFAG